MTAVSDEGAPAGNRYKQTQTLTATNLIDNNRVVSGVGQIFSLESLKLLFPDPLVDPEVRISSSHQAPGSTTGQPRTALPRLNTAVSVRMKPTCR
jgi:hypothetical protein